MDPFVPDSEPACITGAAMRYLARRYSVVPLRPRDKRPVIRWEHLQHERPSGDMAPARAGRVSEGQRNSSAASLAGHLLWHQVDPEVVLELLLAWNRMRCQPTLADSEVAQVVSNIVRLHFDERGDLP